MGGRIPVGVLALQGSFAEHLQALGRQPGIEPVAVKTAGQLQRVAAIILPGGESTTLRRLLDEAGLTGLLKARIQDGLPVWGTCAGAILLAARIAGETPHLGVMDITVCRNAYGRQIDSFSAAATIPPVSPDPVPLVFIRAPVIEGVGPGVQVLCQLDGRIVAARQEHMLATSFHPELTDDDSFYRYFLSFLG